MLGPMWGGYCEGVMALTDNKAVLHCFEPSKATFNVLKKNCHKLSGTVFLNNSGISNEIKNATLYYEKSGSVLASLYKRQLDDKGIAFTEKENIKLDTIDNYCANAQISSIDLLKLDIEGNELNALKGADMSLKYVGVIQMEFGGANIDSRTYFRDFWNLLSPNFKVYRILRDGLREIKSYDEKLEIFTCTNYLFINKRL